MRNITATLQLGEAAVILQCGPGRAQMVSQKRREHLPNDVNRKLLTAQLETVDLLTVT